VFVSEPIEVERNPTDKTLAGFTWRGQPRKVVKTIATWQNWGFPGGVHKGTWRMRHHRNYYRVECDDNKIYEIYLDRKTSENPVWILYRILDSP
jgi:hypothetical protein